MCSTPKAVLTAALIAMACSPSRAAESWPAFRGPGRTGVVADRAAPHEWSVARNENIRWRAPLPAAGNSSPVVAGNRVFVTCPSDEGRERGLYALDAADGRLLWQRTVRHEAEDPTHPTNPYCSPSPAVDERRVVVWHGSAGMHCYDHDGRPLWSRDLGTFRHVWGYAASPVLWEDKVVLHCGPGVRQFVMALNAADGGTLWQREIPGGADGIDPAPGESAPDWIASWASPVIVGEGRSAQVLVAQPGRVQAYSLADGTPAWHVGGLGKLVYGDVVLGDGIGIANSADPGAMIGFRLGGNVDATERHALWRRETRALQSVGSGVIVAGSLYLPNEEGVLYCLDAATGAERWKQRLGGGRTWCSAVVIGRLLYVATYSGRVFVIRPDPAGYDLLAENDLGEPTNSTPAAADGRLYLRSFGHVVCVEAPARPAEGRGR